MARAAALILPPFAARLACCSLLACSVLVGCGGSSSETPFPAPPLPDYLKPKASAASSSAERAASAPSASVPNTAAPPASGSSGTTDPNATWAD